MDELPPLDVREDEDGREWLAMPDYGKWVTLGFAPVPQTVSKGFWHHVWHGLLVGYPLLEVLAFAWRNRFSFIRPVVIDVSRFRRELDRMEQGEIPFNTGYLNELLQTSDGSPVELEWEVEVNCDLCGSPAVWMDCPECAFAPSDACSLCKGVGGFWECENCNEDGGIADRR
jgi:hypothetical protein